MTLFELLDLSYHAYECDLEQQAEIIKFYQIWSEFGKFNLEDLEIRAIIKDDQNT